jgi:membrane-associated phospholipid phosphatase
MNDGAETSRKKRLLEFLSIFLTLGMIAAIGTLVFLGWLTDQVFEGDMRQFDDVTRAALLNITLKLAFQRPRPVPFFDLTAPETFSFPSGHSLASCCFFAGLAAILSGRIKRKRTRTIIWIVAALMFLLIGLSRIYLGVHYTTDVIAGFASALIWILVVRFVENQLARRRKRKTASES